MLWNRRAALRLTLLAATAGTIGACDQPAAVPPRPSFPPGFPLPEQTAALFEEGSRHQLDTGDWATASTVPGGSLRLPTGRLVAADPAWDWRNIEPFTVAVAPGAYPLTLAVVTTHDDERVAAVKMTVRDEPVVTWEMALRPGQDPAALAPGEAYDVGVDSGTMALVDNAALPAIGARIDADPSVSYVRERTGTVELTDPSSGGNMVIFRTGYGDGGYPLWVGRTAAKAVSCFVVDMAMLPRATGRSTVTDRPTGISALLG